MSSAEAQFLPGSDAHNVASPKFVYYRVYHDDGAIATKRPAYLNNKYIGRIRSEWVTPPHTGGSLKLCLCSMENIDLKLTKLFASGSDQSALADQAPISLKTLGIILEDPVILLSEAMPQAEMERGTESFCVPPDSKSPVAPRFLFYGVYSEARAQASKAPIDARRPSLSKIDLYSIFPPVSVPRLLHILNMKEGIIASSALLAQDGLTPPGDDQIFTKNGNWLGASAEDHLVLKFSPLFAEDHLVLNFSPPFAEGSQYRIESYPTGRSLAVTRFGSIMTSPAGYDDGPRKHFTLERQDDGSVGIRNVHTEKWIGHYDGQPYARSFKAISEKHHFFWLIPSTTKNCFCICAGDGDSRVACYDYGAATGAPTFFQWTALDTTDKMQMWSLMPVQPPVTRETGEQCCCLVV